MKGYLFMALAPSIYGEGVIFSEKEGLRTGFHRSLLKSPRRYIEPSIKVSGEYANRLIADNWLHLNI